MVVKNRKKRDSVGEDPRDVLLQSWDSTDLEMLDARFLASIRSQPSPLSDLISQPGSDADEVVSVSEASYPAPQEEAGSQGSNQDSQQEDGMPGPAQDVGLQLIKPELAAMLNDKPMARLAQMQKLAASLSEAGDLHGLLHLRRHMLAQCKVAQALWSVLPEGEDVLALSAAHYELALAYADVGYEPQALDHCRWALEELPRFDGSEPPPEAVKQLRKNVQMLRGEIMLNGKRPREQEALKCFLATEGASDLQGVQDPSTRIMCCQCQTKLGVTKLKEARAARAASLAIQDELALLREKVDLAWEKAERAREISSTPAILSTYAGKVVFDEYRNNKRKKRAQEEHQRFKEQEKLLLDAENEAQAEEEMEAELTAEAESLLNSSLDNLFDVTQAEENRLRERVGYSGSAKEHPLMVKLYRQLAHIGMHLAGVYGLMGPSKRKDQIRCLEEVLINHRAYEGLLPHPLVAKAYRELGAVLMEDKQYEKAHNTNSELFELQEKAYADKPASLDVARAECYKLKGNIYVAQSHLRR
uniref:KIF-binding protein n=2 Tax=Dunaliella tertiolecta TaxID=3047 RepID=A0A7S3R0V2_DUNTE